MTISSSPMCATVATRFNFIAVTLVVTTPNEFTPGSNSKTESNQCYKQNPFHNNRYFVL